MAVMITENGLVDSDDFHMTSDVPARLGLKAGALAWPGAALAFEIFRPSRGQSQAKARAWLGLETAFSG